METTTDGTIRLFTHRTGLLSAVGHDLCLRVERFRIAYGEGRIRARFWPDSIAVEGAVDGGELDPNTPTRSERDEIRRNIERDVLQTAAHPEVRFEGEYQSDDREAFDVAGELEMVGVRETIRTTVRRERGAWRAELELTPSHWGIEPYAAMLGSLRLEDRVDVVLAVEPAGGL